MTTIYLSLSTQVAKSTFFMKSPVTEEKNAENKISMKIYSFFWGGGRVWTFRTCPNKKLNKGISFREHDTFYP